MSTIVALLKEWHQLAPPHDILLRHYYAHVQRAYRDGVQQAKGADELLDFLRGKGYQLALVTSSPRAAVDGVLDRLAWRARFDVIVCGDEVPEAKPDPAVYRRACELGGWQPAACVAVEDAPAGVRAAVACGLAVIGVGPVDRHPALRDSGATWVCSALDEVGDVLEHEVTRDGIRR